MHTLQDAASPAHYDFQPAWPNTVSEVANQVVIVTPFGISVSHGHYYRESFDPGEFSMADNNTKRAWMYFTGQAAMPADFFLDSHDSPDGPIYAPMLTRRSAGGGNCGC